MSDNSKTKVVVIRCNSQVKKFTLARIEQLGLDVGLAQLYKNLANEYLGLLRSINIHLYTIKI